MLRPKAPRFFLCSILAFCIIFPPSAALAAKDKPKPQKQLQQAKQAPPPKQVFGFKEVIAKARMLAETGYKDPKGAVPQWLLDITYDQHRDIRFIPEKAYWRSEKLPFELQFFHAGFYFDRTVKINDVTPQGPIPVKFSPDYFNYEKSAADFKDRVPRDMGFAGFRIHCNLNNPDYKDEAAVFLGASYFRAVAKDMHYGLSARGLAVDTAQPAGEEFPWFREFWIQRPGPKDTQIIVYGLLDSPRMTGAYCFVIKPGKETLMDVEATVFLRKAVDKLGIAPMTSMFFYGENTNVRPKDWFRPEVHDSDGLMIYMENGEWLWRPLANNKSLWVNVFQADNIKGFGLMQRDLNFDHYQDLESRFENRPSLWCEPKGAWGKGWIELVQIPTEDDIHDNIVAYWRPAAAPVGQPLSFAYSLSWQYPDDKKPPAGRVVATRTEVDRQPGIKKFIVDFEGGDLAGLEPKDGLEGIIDIGSGGRLIEHQLYKNQVTGGWRLVFRVKPEENPTLAEKIMPEKKPIIEMRAFLKHGSSILTETWICGSQL